MCIRDSPEAPALLRGLLDGGALASCWSGAGPSLLGICTHETAPQVAAHGATLLSEAGLAGRVLNLAADLPGLSIEP